MSYGEARRCAAVPLERLLEWHPRTSRPEGKMPSRSWKLPLSVVALWTIPALVFTTQNYASHLQTEHPLGWLRVLRWELPRWYAWALLAPVVAFMARRFRLDAARRAEALAALAVHVVTLAALTVVHTALHVGTVALLGWNAEPWPSVGGEIVHSLAGASGAALLVYALIVAACYALDYSRAMRARELAAAQLEGRLVQAQLQSLKMQLRPHFLFNTLHGISGLMNRDVNAARAMLTRLSELLRLALDGDGDHEVPLRDELVALQLYLDIQQMRFRDRLAVDVVVAPEALDAWVPKLFLQPLVENAVHHGVAGRATPARIEIRAERREERVRVEVRDDGPGLPRGGPVREHVGVGNTRVRLRHLYGDAHRLDLRNGPRGGCVVTVEIPHHVGPVLAWAG